MGELADRCDFHYRGTLLITKTPPPLDRLRALDTVLL